MDSRTNICKGREHSLEECLEKEIKFITFKEYREKYHNISNVALGYACSKGFVDYVKLGRVRHICLTSVTADYVPRNNKAKGRQNGKF